MARDRVFSQHGSFHLRERTTLGRNGRNGCLAVTGKIFVKLHSQLMPHILSYFQKSLFALGSLQSARECEH